ncbi:protein TolR [Sandarakinorhabdus cyanobacteriorum]|uniref:Protein TolR n=1 Tax=Sandarakinorhabdus cyanobacteriorum TaxID=1981098 RepID=A0A255YI07_9SPHN|nr:protein TolR [Sandarakinorhabdus cyanobacteriorum]OYQ28195.1 protein TolR [Sandarakinorhabdus cyanobacteriorum]
MGMGSPGLKRGSRRQPMAEINVTPLVDVMLVLLIIFMVTAPLLVAGVPVDLPDARAQSLPQDNTPIQISLNDRGEIFVDRLGVASAALPAKLSALRQARSDEARVYVRADRRLDYGRVMAVVGEVNSAGFRKVALVTDGAPAPGPGSAQ